MPAWSNTDNHASKPKWDTERETRATVTATTANSTAASANTILFTGTAAPTGVVVGQSVYAANLSANGVGSMFKSNNQVAGISGNLVSFTANTFGTIPSGTVIEFDTAIVYNSNKPIEVNYNSDTVLVTPTRLANAVFASGTNYTSAQLASSGGASAGSGWNKVTTFTGGRAGRVQTEVLVALANPVAANTLSGNTSNSGTYFAGV